MTNVLQPLGEFFSMLLMKSLRLFLTVCFQETILLILLILYNPIHLRNRESSTYVRVFFLVSAEESFMRSFVCRIFLDWFNKGPHRITDGLEGSLTHTQFQPLAMGRDNPHHIGLLKAPSTSWAHPQLQRATRASTQPPTE